MLSWQKAKEARVPRGTLWAMPALRFSVKYPILPKIGGLISGDSYAYQYLNETVETFPYGAAFGKLMTENGFSSVTATPLTFGVATVYQGVK